MPSFVTLESDAVGPLPVVPDAPYSDSFDVPQFDPSQGDLISATIYFPATLFATAFAVDIFPSGFSSFATADITSLITFEGGAGGPEFETAMAVIATGGAFLPAFGSATILLNTQTASDLAVMTDLTGAIGTGSFAVDFAVDGVLTGFPLPSLLQQDLILFGVVTYEYVGFDVARLFGTRAGERINGDAGKDRIEAGGGKDVLYGFGGMDDLLGEGGNDRLFGGKGRDFLEGGDGNDRLKGGDGGDSLEGEQGRDRLEGGAGQDMLLGGAGADRLFGDGGADNLQGGNGDDVLKGGAGADILGGDGGRDVLVGGGGGDRFIFDSGSFADVILDFGRGRDQIDFTSFFIDFDEVTITDIGADVLIAVVGVEDFVVRLDGVGSVNALSEDDFIL